jgi:hypothetical protein
LGVGRTLASGEYMVSGVSPQFGDGARPVVKVVPVWIADRGEQAGGLLLPHSTGLFDPRPEGVGAELPLEVELGVVLGLRERLDQGGEAPDVGMVERKSEPSFLAVGVGLVAGELAE